MGDSSSIVGQGTAFDTAGYVLNQARGILNDTQVEGGEILTDDWDQSYNYLNMAYRMCQSELADNGVETNVKEYFMDGITPVANSDPATQVWITQSGYYDGANNHANPHLPGDLIIPLRLWERFSGTQNPFVQVTPAIDGLSGFALQVPYFRFYDWRADALYLPGATMSNEIRMRYVAYYPELTQPDSVVPFRRISVALAYMTAFIFAQGRGDMQAGGLKAMADEQLDNIITNTTRRKQRRAVSRRPYGGYQGRRWLF